jgi:PAS domain-containing protein
MPRLVSTCTRDGMCGYLSPQWVAFTGVPLEKQLGNSWAEVLHPDDRGRAFMAWKNTLIWAQP